MVNWVEVDNSYLFWWPVKCHGGNQGTFRPNINSQRKFQWHPRGCILCRSPRSGCKYSSRWRCRHRSSARKCSTHQNLDNAKIFIKVIDNSICSNMPLLTWCARTIRGTTLHKAVGIRVAGPCLVCWCSIAKRILEPHNGEQVEDLAFTRFVSW